jgi:hypothetical protein
MSVHDFGADFALERIARKECGAKRNEGGASANAAERNLVKLRDRAARGFWDTSFTGGQP